MVLCPCHSLTSCVVGTQSLWGLDGFSPHTGGHRHINTRTHISIHTGSICYSTAGGVILSDTIVLRSGKETHIHMLEHTHTHLYVVILQSTSKALGIEIPFLSLFSIWWQRGKRGGKQLYLQPKVRVGMCSNISEHLQHHMCEYFAPSFPER